MLRSTKVMVCKRHSGQLEEILKLHIKYELFSKTCLQGIYTGQKNKYNTFSVSIYL